MEAKDWRPALCDRCGHSILRHAFPPMPRIDEPAPRVRPRPDEYGCKQAKCMCPGFLDAGY